VFGLQLEYAIPKFFWPWQKFGKKKGAKLLVIFGTEKRASKHLWHTISLVMNQTL
jgi:hypothetical protein